MTPSTDSDQTLQPVRRAFRWLVLWLAGTALAWLALIAIGALTGGAVVLGVLGVAGSFVAVWQKVRPWRARDISKRTWLLLSLGVIGGMAALLILNPPIDGWQAQATRSEARAYAAAWKGWYSRATAVDGRDIKTDFFESRFSERYLQLSGSLEDGYAGALPEADPPERLRDADRTLRQAFLFEADVQSRTKELGREVGEGLRQHGWRGNPRTLLLDRTAIPLDYSLECSVLQGESWRGYDSSWIERQYGPLTAVVTAGLRDMKRTCLGAELATSLRRDAQKAWARALLTACGEDQDSLDWQDRLTTAFQLCAR